MRRVDVRRWGKVSLPAKLLFAAAACGLAVALPCLIALTNRGGSTVAAAPPPAAAAAVPAAGDPALAALKAKYVRPKDVPAPADNASSAAREELGRALFFDPRLSGSDWISCATCHNPALGWGDGLPRAVGHGMKVLGRRTPTILDLAWGELYFWDGRAASLEEQALGPIQSPGEMNQPIAALPAKLRAVAEYAPLFERAYPGEGITNETIAKAIAAFERTVVSGRAPFDRWVEGDERAVSDAAKRGFQLFNGQAHCAACHSGWRFTDDGFHDIGVPGGDRGRGAILTDIEASQFAFKTPTLRNVDRRAPFLHDGSSPTLEDVVALYDAGGRVRRPSLSKEIRPLNLSQEEKDDLVAFLKALTSADRPVEIPSLPR